MVNHAEARFQIPRTFTRRIQSGGSSSLAIKVSSRIHNFLEYDLISISIGGNQDMETCVYSASTPLFLSEERETQVRYTYRVFWTVSHLKESAITELCADLVA